MLTSGDVIDVDLGMPEGQEAGYRHPAVLVTAQQLLESSATVVQVVPLTSTIRGYESEIEVEPDSFNGLTRRSVAQCQHIRSIAVARIHGRRGHVGAVALSRIRELLGAILDIPE